LPAEREENPFELFFRHDCLIALQTISASHEPVISVSAALSYRMRAH
jgi:hypothetical protein